MITKMARFSALTLALVGLSLASVGCEENNQGMNQTKQACPKGGKGGKCCKSAKKCGAGCKKACCKSAKKCGADCKKACCKSGKMCPAGCTKPCCKKV